MTRIKIVEIVGDSEGGGTRFVAALLQQLDRSRFELSLVAPYAPWLAECCAECDVVYVPLPLKQSRLSGRVRRDLGAMLARQRPDLIHAHGTRAAWFALGSRYRRAPLVYSEHLFSFDARRGPLKWPWYAIERRICRHAQYITTSCQLNAQRILRAGWTQSQRIWLDHYGFALDAARAQARTALGPAELGLAVDAELVGTVGRLIPQKGIHVLVDAAPAVLAQHPTAVFLVVGDGPQRAELEARCRARGVSEHFRWLGADTAPWRLLARCVLIALPSLWEGMPATAVEAHAIGLPIVATDVGGIPEVVSHERSGLLVPPGDAAALSGAITRLLDEPVRRTAMGAAGEEIVRQYGLDETIAEIAALYEQGEAHAR
jgi:glycosyltransferase involved in cell wall biosynthesis